MKPPDAEASAAFPQPGGPLYWLLVAVVLPPFNWWLCLWVVVLARGATPLLVVLPLLLAAESVALAWLQSRRGYNARPGRLGTAALLLLTTIVWSFALTLIALEVQHNGFTF